MKTTVLILITTCCISISAAFAAEKSKVLLQLDAARAAVEALSAKTSDNREAVADLESASNALKSAGELSEKERQLFGFGEIKPEAELEIKRYLEIADLATTAAAARLEKKRAEAELETLDKQLAGVKAKLKKFEDRKAELEALKAEKSKLASQQEKQQAEIKALTIQLEEAKKAASKKGTIDQAVPAQPVAAPVTPVTPAAAVQTPEAKEATPLEIPPTTEIPIPLEPAPAQIKP